MTTSPAWFVTSNRKPTKPASGLVRDACFSITFARAVNRSPGRTGFSHFTSSTPGEPIDGES